MDGWHWGMIGGIGVLLVFVFYLAGCAAPPRPGVYSQISVISLPVHER